jgi:hypothetical protein
MSYLPVAPGGVASSGVLPTGPTGARPAAAGPPEKKEKAKSEKRSQSMTLWWAKRKKDQAAQNAQKLSLPGLQSGSAPGLAPQFGGEEKKV